MPRVDSVGGASAGVPIKNDCVWNDCFPRVSREDFKRVCVPFFKNLAKEFGVSPLRNLPLLVMYTPFRQIAGECRMARATRCRLRS